MGVITLTSDSGPLVGDPGGHRDTQNENTMKTIALGLALCLAAACATEKKASMGDATAPTAPKAECCDTKMKEGCEAKKECETKVCPVTGNKIEG